MSLSELGQYEEALPALEKAFKQSADPALRRMAGLQLQRAYTGLARDADAVDVALELTRLYPDDPEVLYHASRLLANFAYLRRCGLSRGRAGLGVGAPGGGRSEREPGAVRRGIERVSAGARRSTRNGRASISARPGAALARAEQDAPAADAAREARRSSRRSCEIDPTNANAAYEIAEIRRKAGELERGAHVLRARARSTIRTSRRRSSGSAARSSPWGSRRSRIAASEQALDAEPASEVAYYQLRAGARALGDTAEQEKALATFERLRDRAEQRTAAATADPA